MDCDCFQENYKNNIKLKSQTFIVLLRTKIFTLKIDLIQILYNKSMYLGFNSLPSFIYLLISLKILQSTCIIIRK